jgi:hypothetical protein
MINYLQHWRRRAGGTECVGICQQAAAAERALPDRGAARKQLGVPRRCGNTVRPPTPVSNGDVDVMRVQIPNLLETKGKASGGWGRSSQHGIRAEPTCDNCYCTKGSKLAMPWCHSRTTNGRRGSPSHVAQPNRVEQKEAHDRTRKRVLQWGVAGSKTNRSVSGPSPTANGMCGLRWPCPRTGADQGCGCAGWPAPWPPALR